MMYMYINNKHIFYIALTARLRAWQLLYSYLMAVSILSVQRHKFICPIQMKKQNHCGTAQPALRIWSALSDILTCVHLTFESASCFFFYKYY